MYAKQILLFVAMVVLIDSACVLLGIVAAKDGLTVAGSVVVTAVLAAGWTIAERSGVFPGGGDGWYGGGGDWSGGGGDWSGGGDGRCAG